MSCVRGNSGWQGTGSAFVTGSCGPGGRWRRAGAPRSLSQLPFAGRHYGVTVFPAEVSQVEPRKPVSIIWTAHLYSTPTVSQTVQSHREAEARTGPGLATNRLPLSMRAIAGATSFPPAEGQTRRL